RAVDWPEAVAMLARQLQDAGGEAIGAFLSPGLPNEDLWLARRLLVDILGVRAVALHAPPRTPGVADDLLIVADKHPNSRGAELMGFAGAATGGADASRVLEAARAGRLRVLWVFGHDLLDAGWSAAEVAQALDRVPYLVFKGAGGIGTSLRARLVLPKCAWDEGEQSAVKQDRVGANRASIRGFRLLGLFHPLTDAVKMLVKEDFIPARADRLLFLAAPVVSVFFALSAFATIPFGPIVHLGGREVSLQAVTLSAGILYVFAMLSMGVYGVMLAGWASANNYALLGG